MRTSSSGGRVPFPRPAPRNGGAPFLHTARLVLGGLLGSLLFLGSPWFLGCGGGPRVVDPSHELARQMRSPDSGARLQAALAVADLEYIPEELEEPLRELLTDQSPAVRAAAAGAIAAAGPEAAEWIPLLVTRQGLEAEPEVRTALQQAVERIAGD